jgi:Icc protein
MFICPRESDYSMSFRIAQISDSHLSDEKPYFVSNFACIVEALNQDRPDLVLHSGDISFDGVSRVGDFVAARVLLGRIDVPVRFIPGNHDVGESCDALSHSEPNIDERSRARYCAHFGADFWTFDVPGWRLLAINAMLLGSDLAASQEQDAAILDAVASLEGRQLALFLHKPLFDQSPEETNIGGRFINPKSRGTLLSKLNCVEPALVASGHIHQYRETRRKGTRYVWAPSTGYIIPDHRQPRYGLKEVGYAEHRLEPDGSHESRLVRVTGVPTLSISDFCP